MRTPQPEPTFKCRVCLDVTWVDVEGQPSAVRPCHVCRPEQHAHWRSGGYRTESEGGWVLSKAKGGNGERSAA